MHQKGVVAASCGDKWRRMRGKVAPNEAFVDVRFRSSLTEKRQDVVKSGHPRVVAPLNADSTVEVGAIAGGDRREGR